MVFRRSIAVPLAGRVANGWALLLLILASSAAGQVTISGRVLDESGNPLRSTRVILEDILTPLLQFSTPTTSVTTANDGSFRFEGPPSTYVLSTSPSSAFNPDHKRVDARSGNVTGVTLLPTTGPFAFVPDTTPDASRIEISSADAAGMATITGRAGAVIPSSIVIFSTLETGHLSTIEAMNDGSFSATHFAPAGSFVLIKVDPYGHLARRALRELAFEGEGSLSALPGTIVKAPEPPPSAEGIAFASTGLYEDQRPPIWFLDGTINRVQFGGGETLIVRGRLRIESRSLAAAGTITARIAAGLELLARSDGTPVQPHGIFASTVLLPTGFPTEHGSDPSTPGGLGVANVPMAATSTERAEGLFEISMPIRPSLPQGHYRPTLWILLQATGNIVENPPRPLMVSDRIDGRRSDVANLPVIRIGTPAPPRTIWMLLADELSAGGRGVVALEDRETFGLASRIVTHSDTLVVPRLDARSGKPLRYRLEPYAPIISLGDRAVSPSPPRVPFRFPSGSLRVRIRKPDGSTETIGPAPFTQSRQSTPTDRRGFVLDQSSGTLSDVYQLTTTDPRFVVSFAQDGDYRIEMEGSIDDLWGNSWLGRGTYDITVAGALSLDTGTMPGTPFEVGDTLTPSITFAPPVPADVSMRVQWFPGSNRALKKERTVSGRANRFGHFAPQTVVRFEEAGEYRVDVTARWVDGAGNMGAGSRSWGGVVTTRPATIEMHGKRGVEAAPEPNTAWFVTPRTFGHVFAPFHSGDVQWAQQYHAALPQLTFHDVGGSIVPLLKQRAGSPPNLDGLAAIGELPLYWAAPPFSLPMYFDPAASDLWGYVYTAIERPLVRVREQNYIRSVPSMYWRFRSQYADQPGVGANGDLPNDFKFQFGGGVLRGAALDTARYGIYASLFVMAPEDDPHGGSRIFPPFRGNGGGPDGGPLFVLKQREIDLFFHPTATRPGTILQRGERAAFSGYSAPTLPSKLEITVTAPSGATRLLKGQANLIGYFYDPATDFTADEAGLWKAKAKITFEGRTSAGQVTPPFPTGDVLGSRDGEFWFYVVEPHSPPLDVTVSSSTLTTSPGGAPFVRPANGPVTFTVTPPAGLTNMELHITTTMPGFLLEELRQSPAAGSQLIYVYDAQRLARDFPNLDLHDADGFAGADTITISFLLSGTDSAGTRRHFARQVVIQGEELQMPEQKETIINPRRRGVRR